MALKDLTDKELKVLLNDAKIERANRVERTKEEERKRFKEVKVFLLVDMTDRRNPTVREKIYKRLAIAIKQRKDNEQVVEANLRVVI